MAQKTKQWGAIIIMIALFAMIAARDQPVYTHGNNYQKPRTNFKCACTDW